MTELALQAESLFRFFHVGDDETLALRGVSLSLRRGEIVAVTGPSGSGKSTLLACLAGLDEPDGGQVQIEGARLTRRPEAHRARLRAGRVGMLYQQANLIAHLTVANNVALAQQMAGPHVRRPRCRDVLEQCSIAHRSGHRPPQLSGGELARAGLAVALANDPAVILADEPTGELDSVTADHVLTLLRDRARQGAAILLVTHSPVVAAFADREIVLADGRIEA